MILKGSQRGGARQLAAHLLNTRDNEHVEVHELRGFLADDLGAAFQEAQAVSRGTRAKQFLFSLSLSPPPQERVDVATLEAAIESVERKLGLDGQPRAIVFHEKDGRRHAHAVWSRIDTERMKAINLPHFKLKLREVSRQLYMEHGWQMPRGLADSRERNPLNFTRTEWEQAKRAKQDPRTLKAMFRECWAISDSGRAYAQALAARGYTLARGDRRGHVAVDFRGQVYAIAKWSGLRAEDTRSRLDALTNLPTVEQAQSAIAARMTDRLREYITQADTARNKQLATLALQRAHLVERQRKERADLKTAHDQRWTAENAERASRLNRGIRGLWDRLTGRYARQARANEQEALGSLRRDRRETDTLIERHLDERRSFHTQARQQKQAHEQDTAQLHRDVAEYARMRQPERPRSQDPSRDGASERGRRPDGNGRSRDRGPPRDR